MISSASASEGPSDASDGAQGTSAAAPKVPKRFLGSWTWVVIGVVILAVGSAVAVVWIGGLHHAPSSTSSSVVLAPSGTSYSLPIGQISGVVFSANATSTLHGSVNSSEGVQMYIMDMAQYETFGKTGNVTGYEWTSGAVRATTIYDLDVSVPTGSWILVFSDPNTGIPTGVSVYSSILLTTP